MSNWKIIFENQARKQMLKLDYTIQKQITKAINEKLLINPNYYLEQLTGELSKYCKFRVGDYRLICEKKEDKLIIVVIKIKHRKEVYKI